MSLIESSDLRRLITEGRAISRLGELATMKNPPPGAAVEAMRLLIKTWGPDLARRIWTYSRPIGGEWQIIIRRRRAKDRIDDPRLRKRGKREAEKRLRDEVIGEAVAAHYRNGKTMAEAFEAVANREAPPVEYGTLTYPRFRFAEGRLLDLPALSPKAVQDAYGRWRKRASRLSIFGSEFMIEHVSPEELGLPARGGRPRKTPAD